MTTRIEFILDLAAPNAYLAWYPLNDLAARHGVGIIITPVFLGGMHKLTGNAPPMVRDADVRGKVAYAALEFHRFLDKHGMDKFRMHPALPFNSILLQRLLLTVDGDERARMVEALLPVVWEDNIDCGDVNIVGSVLENAGFDAAALLRQTQNPDLKQRLMDNTADTVERGAFGIPTFFVRRAGQADEMFFGKERLGQIDEMLAAAG